MQQQAPPAYQQLQQQAEAPPPPYQQVVGVGAAPAFPPNLPPATPNDGSIELKAELPAEPEGGLRGGRCTLAIMDVSGSMAGGKLDKAKRSLRTLQRRCIIHDKFALASFSTDIKLVLPLTPCDQEISMTQYLDHMQASGGTSFYDAVCWGIQLMESWLSDSPIKQGQVIVLTDGEDTDSRHSVAETRAKMKATSVELIFIGVGADAGHGLQAVSAPVKPGAKPLAKSVWEQDNSAAGVAQGIYEAQRAWVQVSQRASDEVWQRFPRQDARSRSRSPPPAARAAGGHGRKRSVSPPRGLSDANSLPVGVGRGVGGGRRTRSRSRSPAKSRRRRSRS